MQKRQMDEEPKEQWSFKNKIKWVLIESAPYTASGFNEIMAGAEYRSGVQSIARAFGVKVSRQGRYRIIKMEDTDV